MTTLLPNLLLPFCFVAQSSKLSQVQPMLNLNLIKSISNCPSNLPYSIQWSPNSSNDNGINLPTTLLSLTSEHFIQSVLLLLSFKERFLVLSTARLVVTAKASNKRQKPFVVADSSLYLRRTTLYIKPICQPTWKRSLVDDNNRLIIIFSSLWWNRLKRQLQQQWSRGGEFLWVLLVKKRREDIFASSNYLL